jgi:hypothetical protein
VQPGWTTASFSAVDCLARVAEHVQSGRARRREDDGRAWRGRSWRHAGRPARLRRTATTSPSAARTRARRAVTASNCRWRRATSAAGRTAATRRLEVRLLAVPPESARSAADVRRRVRADREARRRSSMRLRKPAVVDFAVSLPTTWIAGNRFCGSPSSRSRGRIPPRPEAVGRPRADRTQPSASSSARYCSELSDARPRRPSGAALATNILVREHLLAALDLLAPRPRSAPRRRLAIVRGTDYRHEDPQRLPADLDPGTPLRR